MWNLKKSLAAKVKLLQLAYDHCASNRAKSKAYSHPASALRPTRRTDLGGGRGGNLVYFFFPPSASQFCSVSYDDDSY